MMKISPARIAAYEVLKRVEAERAFSSVLLPAYEEQLAANDASLCHELVLGTLRRQMYLDALIDAAGRSKKLDVEVRVALRLGTYQLIYLDRVPPYSAIDESVNLVQRAKKNSARGYVNAVLRSIQRGLPVLTFHDDVDRMSVEHSHPRWLVERWVDNFGEEATVKLLAANNLTPDVAFRVTRSGRLSGYRPAFHAKESEYVPGCFLLTKIDRAALAAASEGSIYFQDEGSQIVGHAVEVDENSAFLDVCAAPGSKTTQIAANFGVGTIAIAGDLHFSRVRHLLENCKRQGADFVSFVQYDAEQPLPFSDGSFETVLVDAPCTGTGTIRHNPEIRYLLGPGDPSRMAQKQLRILRNAAATVKQGRRLVYSTCSLEPEENEAVAMAFAASNREFELRTPRVPERFVAANGFARISPARDDMDGFFIASFERVAG